MIRPFQFLVPVRVLFLFLSDALLIFASYAVAGYYASESGRVAFLLANDWPVMLLPCGAILFGYYFSGLYADLRTPGLTSLVQRLSQPIGVVVIVEAFLNYLNLDWALPAWIAIPGSVLALASDVVWRRLFSAAIQDAVAARRVLFLGISPSVERLWQHLRKHPELGILPIGYLDDAAPGAGAVEPAPLGPTSSLLRQVDEYEPNWIVVADRRRVDPGWTGEFLRLRFSGIGAADAAGFYETTLARVCLAEMDREDAVFDQSLRPDQFNINVQSMYSVFLACLMTPVVLPLIAITALFVKTVSPSGPAFVREKRIGKNGAEFTIHRLRLSYPDSGVQRDIPLAGLLRRLGLDALPLLWNLLRGEMSIAGPQPDRPEFAERLDNAIPFHFQRTAVKPGVTGWAQTHDVGDDPMHDAARRLEFDLYYIKNLSPALDVLILLRSVRQLRLFVL